MVNCQFYLAVFISHIHSREWICNANIFFFALWGKSLQNFCTMKISRCIVKYYKHYVYCKLTKRSRRYNENKTFIWCGNPSFNWWFYSLVNLMICWDFIVIYLQDVQVVWTKVKLRCYPTSHMRLSGYHIPPGLLHMFTPTHVQLMKGLSFQLKCFWMYVCTWHLYPLATLILFAYAMA